MINLLLLLSPREVWPALIALGALLVIFGLRKVGFGIIATICLLAVFTPFLDSLLASLPLWAMVGLTAAFFIMLFRVIFGRRVLDNIISAMILGLFKIPFRFLGWFFRIPGRRP